MNSPINIWYLPTNYGDVRLESVDGGKATSVRWYKLTVQEAFAMAELRKASIGSRRKWTSAESWTDGGPDGFAIGEKREHTVLLQAPLPRVARVLSKGLHAGRSTVDIIRVGNGVIEEISSTPYDNSTLVQLTPSEDAPAEPEVEETALAATGTESTQPVKATTVKKPVKGCPAPNFEQVRVRATEVLQAFLDPQQVADFNRYQRFITRGGATGHDYMLVSRNAPDELARWGRRTVRDLSESRSYCVHDWDVPAEEELLGLHVLLSLPQYEHWVREIPA